MFISHLSADILLLAAAFALLSLPSLPSPLERDAGVLTLTAPEPPNLGVKGLLIAPGVLGLLREDAVGSVLKDAAVRMGEGGRRGKACSKQQGKGSRGHDKGPWPGSRS